MENLIQNLFQALNFSDNYEKFDNGKIRLLSDLIESGIDNDPINFYPGRPSSGCFSKALFASLNKQPRAVQLRKDQLISLEDMLKIMFEHIFLKCLGSTRQVAFVTDHLDTMIFQKYKTQFDALKTLGISYEIWYFKESGSQLVNNLIF